MGILETLSNAKGAIAAIAFIGLSAIGLDARHAPASQVNRMEASGRVDTINDWIKVAREEGVSEYVCTAIVKELDQLCITMKEHYLCSDQARKDTLKRAGCE